MSGPIVFSSPDHGALLPLVTSAGQAVALGQSTCARFPNGELYARIEGPVAGRVCGVLGTLAPPDEQMLSLLLLAHTLGREGAQRVIALLPYMGYARQDRAEPGQSLGIAWAGQLLRACGVDRAITLDVHSRRAEQCLAMPVQSLSPAPLFAAALAGWGLHELTVVAPDEGALDRCRAVIREAGIGAPLAYLRKRRDSAGVTHSELVGPVSQRVAIVDDILDTAGTLVSACTRLLQAGVREIVVLVTHGLFTGERWRELPALGVRRIYATDSVPAARALAGGMIEVLPAGQLVVDAFCAAARGGERASAPPAAGAPPAALERIEGPAPAEDSSVPEAG